MASSLFDPEPASHVDDIRVLLEHPRKHNLTTSPAKANLGAADADCLGHTISSSGVIPNAYKAASLPKLSMVTNVEQSRFLIGSISYHRKFIANVSTCLRFVKALLK